MSKEEIMESLESIYQDYYDGLFTEEQLKSMLLRVQQKSNITDIQEWSEMLLDAQWKHASFADYEKKKKLLIEESVDQEIINNKDRFRDVIQISELKVCKSAAGHYIGRMAQVTYSKTEVPWDRETGFYQYEKDAYWVLEKMHKLH
jgi:hypothetical protein